MRLFQREWFAGFVSGVAATIIGFGFTLAWDIWKMHADVRRRHDVIFSIVREDIGANEFALEHNYKRLQEELAVLPNDQSIADPLSPMHTTFWDSAKADLPVEFSDLKTLQLLRTVMLTTEHVNEFIRDRAAYKLYGSAMSNYKQRLQTVDELMLQALQKAHESIVDLKKAVPALADPKK